MSASPAPTAALPSQKRPLEDPSSESGPGEQPEAKRPALGSSRDDVDNENHAVEEDVAPKTESATNGAVGVDRAQKTESTQEQHNGNTYDGATSAEATAILETQPIQSTLAQQDASGAQGTFQAQHQDETGWLHMRAIISSAEAATIIGKGGENVSLIRRMSGAKCTVSDYSRGAVERILTVSGLVDAVAKVCCILYPILSQYELIIILGLWSYNSHT